jgi:hypothetical protein
MIPGATIPVSFRVPIALVDLLDKVAAEAHCSRAQVTGRAVEFYLTEKYGYEPPENTLK